MPKAYKEFLKCEYSDQEMADMAKELARANQSRETLEQRKKQISSQIKGEIEEQTTVIKRLSSAIREGCEYKDVDCRVELDTPTAGQKRIIRLDTGEDVKVVPMSEHDRQMALDLQTEAEAAAQKEEEEKARAEAEKVIVTPAPALKAIGGISIITADGEIKPVMAATDPEVMSAAEVEAEGAPLASASAMGTGTHQKKKRGKEVAAGDAQ